MSNGMLTHLKRAKRLPVIVFVLIILAVLSYSVTNIVKSHGWLVRDSRKPILQAGSGKAIRQADLRKPIQPGGSGKTIQQAGSRKSLQPGGSGNTNPQAGLMSTIQQADSAAIRKKTKAVRDASAEAMSRSTGGDTKKVERPLDPDLSLDSPGNIWLYANQQKDSVTKCVALEKLVRQYPDYARVPEALWEISLLKDDPTQRIPYLDKIAYGHADSELAPRALFMIGFIYSEELDDKEKAGGYFRELIEKYPDAEITESARWMIDNLDKKDVDLN